jgi:site-specific DNA-methyltransferase (adenine-specific)
MPQLSGDRPAQACEGLAIWHGPTKKRWNGAPATSLWTFCHDTDPAKVYHPTMKPLPLMRRLVEQFSDPGETILDPFTGSGSTGVAAVELGRRFIGCEWDDAFHAVAVERLTAATEGQSLAASMAGQMMLFGRGG